MNAFQMAKYFSFKTWKPIFLVIVYLQVVAMERDDFFAMNFGDLGDVDGLTDAETLAWFDEPISSSPALIKYVSRT